MKVRINEDNLAHTPRQMIEIADRLGYPVQFFPALRKSFVRLSVVESHDEAEAKAREIFDSSDVGEVRVAKVQTI